jgi:hypothetical protein
MLSDPETAVVDDPSQPACLSEWNKYKRFERAASLARRYGHVVALLPFGVAGFIVFRYDVKYGDVLIEATLGWAVLVALAALFASSRVIFICCPSCGLRFGPAKACQWCGFPRYPDGVKHIGEE